MDSTGKHTTNIHAHKQSNADGGWPRNATVIEIGPRTNKMPGFMANLKLAMNQGISQTNVIWDGNLCCELGTISNETILYSTIGFVY